MAPYFPAPKSAGEPACPQLISAAITTPRARPRCGRGGGHTGRGPWLLGAGKRMFDGPLRADLALEQAGVIESPFVTHLRYRLTSQRQTS